MLDLLHPFFNLLDGGTSLKVPYVVSHSFRAICTYCVDCTHIFQRLEAFPDRVDLIFRASRQRLLQ